MNRAGASWKVKGANVQKPWWPFSQKEVHEKTIWKEKEKRKVHSSCLFSLYGTTKLNGPSACSFCFLSLFWLPAGADCGNFSGAVMDRPIHKLEEDQVKEERRDLTSFPWSERTHGVCRGQQLSLKYIPGFHFHFKFFLLLCRRMNDININTQFKCKITMMGTIQTAMSWIYFKLTAILGLNFIQCTL